MESIRHKIETADFGTMFKTRGGSRAIFLRICSNSEHVMADFYVEDWGQVRVDRKTGMVFPGKDKEENDIVGLWENV